MGNQEPVIDICGKRTIEYVFDCISKFNHCHETIRLRAYGCNINTGVEIAQILKDRIGVFIQQCSLGSITLKDVKMPYIEIPLKLDRSKFKDSNTRQEDRISNRFGNQGFIGYWLYHLLLDWHLDQNKKLEIQDRKGKKLLTVSKEGEKVKYQISDFNWSENKEDKNFNKIINTLYRCGIVMPHKWQDIAKMLSKHDDVILGVDTNLLYDCVISTHLLPTLTLIKSKDFVHTPSWILLVVPAVVMFELEEAANIRDEKGHLQPAGRMAFRALQEIIELTNNIDIPGVSLLIVGEGDLNLENKSSLKRINDNLFDLGMAFNNLGDILKDGHSQEKLHRRIFNGARSLRSSSGDMAIRNQFKKFLRQIDFHKGIYFLTGDKSNSALAMAEGLNPILICRSKVDHKMMPLRIFNKKNEDGPDSKNDIEMKIPMGNLIYEFAVTFGHIVVSYNNKRINLKCDQMGRTLENWLHKQLFVKKDDLSIFTEDYEGIFSLKFCDEEWGNLVTQFEDIQWIFEQKGDCFQ
jgi:DNA-binding protein